MQPLPQPLPDDVLSKRQSLPLKVASVVLTGRKIRLEPLVVERDLPALYASSNGQAYTLGDRHIAAYDADELVWRYMNGGVFADANEMASYLQKLVDAPNGLALTVFELESNTPVGVATFMSNMPEHLKVELGSIHYSPIVQGQGINTEATYLMLSHAFGLGYRRVEWKCNALNERSRRAALRMGFKFEGIQEAHFIIKGRNRDTAWFRMLDHEWAEQKVHLEALMAY